MGCGGCRGNSMRNRRSGARALFTPNRIRSSPSRTLTPSEKRILEMKANEKPVQTTAARREIDRKRRLAIRNALGK